MAEATQDTLTLKKKPKNTSGLGLDNLLTEERIEELKLEAQEKVRAELVEKQEKEVLDKLIKQERIRVALDDDHDLVEFKLDLAPSQQDIRIDGAVYYNNTVYIKPRKIYDTLRDVQAQGWRHEAEIHGEPRNKREIERSNFPGNRITQDKITRAENLKRASL